MAANDRMTDDDWRERLVGFATDMRYQHRKAFKKKSLSEINCLNIKLKFYCDKILICLATISLGISEGLSGKKHF